MKTGRKRDTASGFLICGKDPAVLAALKILVPAEHKCPVPDPRLPYGNCCLTTVSALFCQSSLRVLPPEDGRETVLSGKTVNEAEPVEAHGKA